MQPVFLKFALLLPLVSSTTEWWGDLRAHLNPPKSPAFYDVTYDEGECPEGLRADAIPEYVYFGTMIATMSVDKHDECLQKCAEKPLCKAVNYFHPFVNEKGFCELLPETQHDNPRQMRPFKMATYFENIRCRELEYASHNIVDNIQDPISNHEKELETSRLVKKLSNKVDDFNAGFRAVR
ncbi:PAN domain protein [Dictyocaulus viviparus]|uniref:PAN domain protein n=1 Tax=Dictyocaulus viviparus TaxID=29172 RepID=A0A0D8XWZ8_DICVI|nr:PAN domain protein [Dictyocaulus viviparus]